MGKENGGFLFKRFYNTENIVYKKYIRKYARLDVIFLIDMILYKIIVG